jgi:thioredoxin reductase (NADPH)
MSENKGPASRRPRVVYVDDEPFVLNAFRRMVSISGFEPITFATPGEALAWLTAQPVNGPDAVEVVCSDYRMPEMTGLEFLAAAKRVAPGALRVLITAHHDFDMAVDAF